MFLLIRVINRIDRQLEEELAPRAKDTPALPENKKCPYCLSTIAYKAVRCPHCTSDLEAAPEPAAS
jgi:large conductance mechanosensitive channel